ncbi:MAG: hypothetical protein ACREMU_09375, partial [Gemmatimonadaceae bacterium]
AAPRTSAPSPAPQAPAASAAPSAPSAEARSESRPPISVAALRERWGAIAGHLRADGRLTLVAALEHATAVEVSPAGEITLELASDFGHMEAPITNGSRELLAAIAPVLEGATRVLVRVPAAPHVRDGATRRLTAEAVKAERLSSLRRRDPALDAAVRELDLELMD